ncbi:MAG: hypothetical protein FWD89_04545 [Firmicutes bacterium]|nr:hypothetical protein [Bacillota bacterium]
MKKIVIKTKEESLAFIKEKQLNHFDENTQPTGDVVLSGEIKIERDGHIVLDGLTKKEKIEYNTNVLDRRIGENPTLGKIINYIYNNALFSCIVTFAIYNKPVGVYKQECVVYEIRTLA